MSRRAVVIGWIALGWLIWTAPAHAALDVAWDCYLPAGQVRCPPLETAFFSNAAYARATDVVDLTLNIRAVESADGVKYTITATGTDESFTFTDRVPRGFSNDAVLLRLVGDLQKLTAPFFVLDQPGTTTDGVLQLALRDPTLGPRDGRSDDESTGFYLAPSLSLDAERSGILFVSANALTEVNWSHPDWRAKGYFWGNYRLVSADAVTGDEDPADLRYEVVQYGTDLYVVRAWGGLSLAANAFAMHEPQSNYVLRAGTWVGGEWVLVPFLKTDEGNIGAQYVIGPDLHIYVHESVLGKMRHTFMRHRARVAGTWHFTRVDVEGNLGAESVLTDLRFSRVSSYGRIAWRILDDLNVSLEGEVSFRNALVNEPRDLSLLHPLEQFYGGGAYGDVTFWTAVTVQYVFGNSLLVRQDQRWR